MYACVSFHTFMAIAIILTAYIVMRNSKLSFHTCGDLCELHNTVPWLPFLTCCPLHNYIHMNS
jgi:hypothetical protein